MALALRLVYDGFFFFQAPCRAAQVRRFVWTASLRVALLQQAAATGQCTVPSTVPRCTGVWTVVLQLTLVQWCSRFVHLAVGCWSVCARHVDSVLSCVVTCRCSSRWAFAMLMLLECTAVQSTQCSAAVLLRYS
jgi:hypothetical protein